MMILTAQAVMDSTIIITRIINQSRPMPQRGKYLLARLHQKLLPEFTLLTARRDEMIRAYETRLVVDGLETSEFTVPADKMAEFAAAWKEIGSQKTELEVQPIP